jgi:hypothetical protein
MTKLHVISFDAWQDMDVVGSVVRTSFLNLLFARSHWSWLILWGCVKDVVGKRVTSRANVGCCYLYAEHSREHEELYWAVGPRPRKTGTEHQMLPRTRTRSRHQMFGRTNTQTVGPRGNASLFAHPSQCYIYIYIYIYIYHINIFSTHNTSINMNNHRVTE